MSRLESKCEDLTCYDCPFKGAKIVCNLAHNSDLSLSEVLEEVKKDVDKVEKRLSSRVRENLPIIEKELKDSKELDKHLDFSDGALMSGFDYKGQQIVAMPLEEYDKLMKKEEALVILKDLFDFDFALRFPSNQPMLRIENKRTNEYWEIPITQEAFDSMKEILI